MITRDAVSHRTPAAPASPRARAATGARAAIGVTVTVCAVAVILLFTLGKPFIDIPGVLDASAHHRRSLNLMPLHGFISPRKWWAPWDNTLGNIALFAPLGIAIGPGLRRAALIGMGLSLLIETAQYIFALGFSDIDDVVCNTLGAAGGAWLLTRFNPRTLQAWVLFVSTALCTVGAYGLLIGRL